MAEPKCNPEWERQVFVELKRLDGERPPQTPFDEEQHSRRAEAIVDARGIAYLFGGDS